MKSIYFYLQSIALGLCYFNLAYASDELDLDKIIDAINQRVRNAALIEGRGQSFSTKGHLPADLTKLGNFQHLTCEGTYEIGTARHMSFKLNSGGKACHYTFLGSRVDKCTVDVYCNGNISLAAPVGNGCKKEWFALSDGTEGLIGGCGKFHFSKTPRSPIVGHDMYLYLKASLDTPCIAYCKEDLKGSGGVQPAKKIPKNKRYKFQTNNSCTCGKRRDVGRIVNGKSVKKFEFPWMAAIVAKGVKGYERVPFCGASIINDRYLICAAHCFAIGNVRAQQIQVLLHAHVMDKKVQAADDDPRYQNIPGWGLPKETDESEESLRLDVEEIINHPLFSEQTFNWDVAILKLKTKLNFENGKIAPICFPKISEELIFKDKDNLIVTGWGYPEESAKSNARLLQMLDVPYMNLKDCKRYIMASNRHHCAGYLEGGKDACQGDSGGPLQYKYKGPNQYMIAGVVSAGSGCARKNNLGLYTNLAEVSQWVYQHTADAVWCTR